MGRHRQEWVKRYSVPNSRPEVIEPPQVASPPVEIHSSKKPPTRKQTVKRKVYIPRSGVAFQKGYTSKSIANVLGCAQAPGCCGRDFVLKSRSDGLLKGALWIAGKDDWNPLLPPYVSHHRLTHSLSHFAVMGPSGWCRWLPYRP